MKSPICLGLAGLGLTLALSPAQAVPPLVMGDVPPAEKGHVEIYLGTIYEKGGAIERQIPADEFVLGISKRQELTVEVPYLSVSPAQGSTQSGIGDITVGTKFMFLEEAESIPGMALSLESKLDNGDARKDLGSGAVDYDLRWRIQKERDWFTGFLNLGYTFVGEPLVNGAREEKRNVWFGAFAQEYKVSAKTSLLSEVYWANSDTPGERSRFAGDVGFRHAIYPSLQCQAAIGKSLRVGNIGGPQLRVYAGVKLEFAVASMHPGQE